MAARPPKASTEGTAERTARGRMLAAYRGLRLDRMPVAPEFWCYVPARLLGVNMIEFQRNVPFWQALQQTFRHYRCEGWGIVAPRRPPAPFSSEHVELPRPEGRIETCDVLHTPAGDLVWRSLLDPLEPAWTLERPIKDFFRHWPVYEQAALPDPAQYDWTPVQKALDGVGGDYLLEVHAGDPFTDFVGGARQGGFQQMVLDLVEHEDYLLGLRERYVAHGCALVEAALTHTSAESVFVGCAWSCASLLGARLWRKWDRPVIEAFTAAAHRSGGLIHVHLHGRCAELIRDLVEMGVDSLCPLERPPGGDVSPENMAAIKDITRGRTTLNGNVHTVETLIRGTPRNVEREVREIVDLWGDDGRLIVGTGDQVGRETPDENIWAMIETAKSYGRSDRNAPL